MRKYVLEKQENGIWKFQGYLSDGTPCASVYCHQKDLIHIFNLIEGSGAIICGPAQDEPEPHGGDGPEGLALEA